MSFPKEVSLVKGNLSKGLMIKSFYAPIEKCIIYIYIFFANEVQVFYRQKKLLKASTKVVTTIIRKVIDL